MIRAMAFDLTEVQTALESSIAALRAGDFVTARREAIAAELYLAGIADGTQGPVVVSFQKRIADILDQLNREESASGGIQKTKVCYTRPTRCSTGCDGY